MKKTVPLYLHPPLERLWHLVHTVAILVLLVTGFFLRFPEVATLGSYGMTATIHNAFGIVVVVDYVLWIFYLFGSGRLTHYLPKERDMLWGLVNQGFYYGLGIFKGDPHPYHASEDEKFNPLQKWAYIGVMFGLVPLLGLTGILLLAPGSFAGLLEKVGGLGMVSRVHAMLGFAAGAFLVSHVYLATTGSSVFDAFISMVTGWVNEEVSDDHGEEPKGPHVAPDDAPKPPAA
jgi:thiosulfate reductase cytochrome b subunit